VFILLLISLGSDAEENKMAQNKKVNAQKPTTKLVNFFASAYP
jgi:hypothetical protein